MFLQETYELEDCMLYDISSSENVSKYTHTSAFSYNSSQEAYQLNSSSGADFSRLEFVPDFDFELSFDYKISSSTKSTYYGVTNSNYECQGSLFQSWGNTLGVWFKQNGTTSNPTTPHTWSNNIWYHIVLKNENGVLTSFVYRDNTLEASVNTNCSDDSNNVKLRFLTDGGNFFVKNIKFKPL